MERWIHEGLGDSNQKSKGMDPIDEGDHFPRDENGFGKTLDGLYI